MGYIGTVFGSMKPASWNDGRRCRGVGYPLYISIYIPRAKISYLDRIVIYMSLNGGYPYIPTSTLHRPSNFCKKRW